MSKKLKSKSGHQPTRSQCARFEFVSAESREVFVAGSFNDWSPTASRMVRLGDGLWVKELALPPGRREYRFVVGGEWVDDPNAREFVPNPHRGMNAVLIVPNEAAIAR